MKYKCCNLIKHGLCFFDNVLVSCCFSPNDQINGGRPPVIRDNYKGEILTKQELFGKINDYVNVFKSGGCIKECLNCYHLEEKEWDDEDYIQSMTITHFSVCQADCIYCSNNLAHNDRTNNVYEILPLLRSYKEQGIIRQGIELHIGGGEFTIYKECDTLLNEFALTGFAKVYIPTNAIKYSETLNKAMQNGSTKIIVSLDSGCRETYKKIKRIDSFNDVINNLKKYSKDCEKQNAISLKYIIIPKVNDNYKEFTNFLKIAKEIGVKHIIIDVDAKYARSLTHEIDEYLIYLTRSFEQKAKTMGFSTELYSFIKQCEEIKKHTKKLSLLISAVKYRFFNQTAEKLYGKI